jgi:transcriptional regulator with XRE-family HTH domain
MRSQLQNATMELKKYRRIAGLTQQKLADKSGVDKSLISRLERGKRQTASYETIVRLARALNLEPEELVPVVQARPIKLETQTRTS